MLFIDLTPVIPMDTQNNFLTFEIFAFDTSNQSHIKTPDNLVHLLASNNSFWKGTQQIDCNSRQIKDNFIEITVNPIKFDQDSKDKCITGFSIVVKGEYDCLEPQRIPILNFFKEQKLETLYIVKDEISEQIAVQIYPYIYRVENHLRAYITKFMTTKIGVNWWKTEAPQDFSKKVNDRKNNETKFASYIDNKLYLIDFNDLGEYIYKLSSGCITKEDLIKKIDSLEETPEAIRKLKEEIKSNYDKFFKESFKDRNFQSNWEKLYKTRNKVAHNNLFTQKELDEAQKIYQDLIQTIKNAEQKLEGLILTTEEVGLIQEEANSIEDRQYPIEKLMDIVGKLPSKKLMAPLRKSPSKKMDLVGKLPSCHSLITPSGLNLRRMKTEKLMDALRKLPSEKLMDLLRKSPSDGFFGLCYAMDGVIRDETLIEKDIDAILSIVFDLERTNQ
jgi:hypothetical protein